MKYPSIRVIEKPEDIVSWFVYCLQEKLQPDDSAVLSILLKTIFKTIITQKKKVWENLERRKLLQITQKYS